jgi:hypothetical protein
MLGTVWEDFFRDLTGFVLSGRAFASIRWKKCIGGGTHLLDTK